MKNICVYCGSSPGRDPAYAEAARGLGRLLVERDLGLVYGGAGVGIMGAIADEVLAHGGSVTGIIPDALAVKEVLHPKLTQTHVVASMHERKALMAEVSDGFVALPGGWGTIEEIFEVLTWAQLGFHDKPCGLLNVNGYYDGLFRFLEHAMAEEFVRPVYGEILILEQDPTRLLERFARYRAPRIRKWISSDDT
jgi:uncharacterized protein (TIGR00730 family)